MTDPRAEALQTLEGLLARAEREPLDAHACACMVELSGLVPGRIKRVAHALSAQRSAPAVDALRRMQAGIPGVVEGLYQAFAHGVVRMRPDEANAPVLLAIDFRRSRSRGFEDLLRRAHAVFGDGFEPLRVGGKLHYRIALFGGRGTLAGRAAAISNDLTWLHAKLARLKGTRLWLNGWCFESGGAFKAPVQAHLVGGWLSWAATQTQTVSTPR
ncbi:MAG: hypothetical protein KUG77_27475 [Nannocystaceae bacterium]|nr:hypothetical protein [Nannocystaceae bacterium]